MRIETKRYVEQALSLVCVDSFGGLFAKFYDVNIVVVDQPNPVKVLNTVEKEIAKFYKDKVVLFLDSTCKVSNDGDQLLAVTAHGLNLKLMPYRICHVSATSGDVARITSELLTELKKLPSLSNKNFLIDVQDCVIYGTAIPYITLEGSSLTPHFAKITVEKTTRKRTSFDDASYEILVDDIRRTILCTSTQSEANKTNPIFGLETFHLQVIDKLDYATVAEHFLTKVNNSSLQGRNPIITICESQYSD